MTIEYPQKKLHKIVQQNSELEETKNCFGIVNYINNCVIVCIEVKYSLTIEM